MRPQPQAHAYTNFSGVHKPFAAKAAGSAGVDEVVGEPPRHEDTKGGETNLKLTVVQNSLFLNRMKMRSLSEAENRPKRLAILIDDGIKSEHVPLTESVWEEIRRQGRKLARRSKKVK